MWFLLDNIVYILLYGSALFIAINNSTVAVAIFCITSHLTLALLFINVIVKRKIVHVEKVSFSRLIFGLAVIGVIIIVLILREHFYLAGVTLLFTGISIEYHWQRKNMNSKNEIRG